MSLQLFKILFSNSALYSLLALTKSSSVSEFVFCKSDCVTRLFLKTECYHFLLLVFFANRSLKKDASVDEKAKSEKVNCNKNGPICSDDRHESGQGVSTL